MVQERSTSVIIRSSAVSSSSSSPRPTPSRLSLLELDDTTEVGEGERERVTHTHTHTHTRLTVAKGASGGAGERCAGGESGVENTVVNETECGVLVGQLW